MAVGQDTIRLKNPSFEDIPRRGTPGYTQLSGWTDCTLYKFTGESPVDIHPGKFWNNNLPASDKKTYLGMVVRDNYTWESVTQLLEKPLQAGKCYTLSLNLAKSNIYISYSHITQKEANYNTPIVLRIYGSNYPCHETVLLAESDPVKNESWQIYSFDFMPKSDLNYITFQAFYKVPIMVPYNGNILVDGCGYILQKACPGEPPLAVAKPKLPPHKSRPNKKVDPPNTQKPIADVPSKNVNKPYNPKILKELNRNNLKKGQIIEIKNLLFKADTFTIEKASYPILEDVYQFLLHNPDVIVEVGGHTNNIPSEDYCNALSTARAKAVTEYLIQKGVNPAKIQFKGYGKSKPIADNKTASGRLKNQRVELKILSIDS